MNTSPVPRRDPALAAVLLLAACGVALAFQGWRARIPTLDLVPHYLDAIALVRDGVIPIRGTISSYLAYNPPGPTWLMAPGVIATDDPRLVEFVVSSLLYAATLLGIYCLARSSFGRPTALLAAALYAFSEVGLFVAGSLWPRAPIQPFVVWMVFWLQRWAVNRQAVALPIALSIWAAGMFVFMEIAPVVLLVPFCWYLYRPPVRLAQLAVAVGAVLLVWWPYLAYEAQNDYRDLQSMVLRTEVGAPAAGRTGDQWCNPRLTLVTETGALLRSDEEMHTGAAESSGTLNRVAIAGYIGLLRIRGAVENTVHGVVGGAQPSVRGSDVVLFLLCAIAVIAVALGSTGLGSFVLSRPLRRSSVRTVLGLALMGVAVAAPPVLVPLLSPDGSIEQGTRDALGALRAGLLAAGALVVFARPISAALARLATITSSSSSSAITRRFLLFALLVPWAALVVLVEPGRSDRLWWLWPFAAIFLAAFVFHLVGMATVRRRTLAVGLGVLIVGLTSVTPSNVARLQSWRSHGWAGADADEIRAIDYIASRVGGQRQVKVGYHLRFFRGIPALSAVDARFKAGAELDLVLAQKYQIVNTSRCAEGLGPDDDYRLADDPSRPSRLGTYHVVAVPGDAFRLVRRFGSTRVFERLGLTSP